MVRLARLFTCGVTLLMQLQLSWASNLGNSTGLMKVLFLMVRLAELFSSGG